MVGDATILAQSLVLKEWPAAAEYRPDFCLAVTSLNGSYSQSALSNVLAQIPLKNASDEEMVAALAHTVLDEANIYLPPAITSDTNYAPYIASGLRGLAIICH